jgi:hypothetical protein
MAKTPFFSGLLFSVHMSCVKLLEKEVNIPEIHACVRESHNLGKKIQAAKTLGHKLAKQAVWIPVTRCDGLLVAQLICTDG